MGRSDGAGSRKPDLLCQARSNAIPLLTSRTMVDSASGPYQAPGARHIVSQGVPQGGRRDGLQAAHEELLQSSIAGLVVGALRCLRPLLVDGLVDGLGVVGIHALPPR